MTASVIQLRDYDARRPPAGELRLEPAEVIILPVVRIERVVVAIVPKPPRAPRRSLLGEPA